MQLNRFLAIAIKTGTYLILFLPLVVFQGMFFPFISGKNFIFRIIIEIISAAWVILALRDRSYFPKRSWLFYFVLASTAALILGTLCGGAGWGVLGGLLLSALIFPFSSADKKVRTFSYGISAVMIAPASGFYFAKD